MGHMHPPVHQEITPEVKKALDKAKIALMSKADTIFFTTILFSLRLIWDNTQPTAATNGTDLYLIPTSSCGSVPKNESSCWCTKPCT